MKLLSPFANWRAGVFSALTRFPWNILCGALGAACAIISIHYSSKEWLVGQCGRLAMTVAVGMPLFFSLRMLRERSEAMRRWPLEALGVPLLAAWFLAQPDYPFSAPTIVAIRWLLLLAALHFFAAVSLFVRGKEGPGFWQFNRRLFLRFCLATLYTAVLTGGLELALLSADKLFQLKANNLYGDLFFVMIGLFHPAFFLAGVPRDFAALEAETEYPRGLKAFTQFALAPLVAVYALILYAYAIKIVIAWNWPRGWVALPVLLLSGIGIFAFLLLYPLRTRAEEKWAIWFTKNFPRALAPLSVLLLLSLRVRITDYGVTEERYLGVVAGGWILAWALTFIIRQGAGIRWIPYSLALICGLAAFGPWSAGAISQASQLRRITNMLQAQGLWKDNHAAPAANTVALADRDQTDLRSTLAYLIETHGGATIQRLFEPLGQFDWKNLTSWVGARDIIAALNVSKPDKWGGEMSVSRIDNAFVDVQGFQRIREMNRYGRGNAASPPSQDDDVRIRVDDGVLTVATYQENAAKQVPLDSLINQLDTKQGTQLPDKDLTLDVTHGARVFRIIFTSLSWRHEQDRIRVENYELYLLEK